MAQDLTEFIESELGGSVPARRKNVAVDCVNCGKERHLYIHVEKGMGFCQRCGYSPSLPRLIADLRGCSMHEAIIQARQWIDNLVPNIGARGASGSDWAKAFENFLSGVSQHQEDEVRPISLPENCVELSKGNVASLRGLRYLQGRGFKTAHLSRYRLLYCLDVGSERCRGHVVFPIYDSKGNVVFYTTRSTTNRTPKTWTPAEAPKRKFMYGLNELRATSTVIVVEGPLDCIALRGHAVALLSKHASDEHIEMLATFRRVVVYLDNDALKEAIDLVFVLKSKGVVASLHRHKRDAADRVHVPKLHAKVAANAINDTLALHTLRMRAVMECTFTKS